MSKHEPRIVAELGRPETPEETAARKAQNSRNHRARQTTKNLVFALIASLAVLAVIVLMVPRSETNLAKPVDVSAVAKQAQGAFLDPIAVPQLTPGWSSNAAGIRRSDADKVTEWYAGYLSPSGGYVGLHQTSQANPSWVAGQLARQAATGSTEIAGVRWTVYDHRETSEDVGNAHYALETERNGRTYLLVGTASNAEFTELAAALAPFVSQ
ncbi:MAG TPA: DUF4245 domain-containing protein [Candidatus Lumbricidophila sp.]|nr:DUF4245 domain-containing protein [Candidatus Lumbricidophila sp.]